MTDRPVRVLVWDEGSAAKAAYPEGLGRTLAVVLKNRPGIGQVATAGPRDPDQGASPAALAEADVLVWWSHHETKTSFTDQAADRIVKAVLHRGMGMVVLHSGYLGKPFRRLMGTGCGINGGAADGKPEVITVSLPDHAVARGVTGFTIPEEERYDGPWDVPEPDDIVFESRFPATGGTFPCGCCWTRGKGRIFYLRPGHEEYRTYDLEPVRLILANAVRWAAGRDTFVIYLYMPDESVDVWRPVEAEHVQGSVYRILPQPYDRTGERWSFEPGDQVHCELRSSGRGRFLTAVRKVG